VELEAAFDAVNLNEVPLDAELSAAAALFLETNFKSEEGLTIISPADFVMPGYHHSVNVATDENGITYSLHTYFQGSRGGINRFRFCIIASREVTCLCSIACSHILHTSSYVL
jgi:hypothetical protein